MSQFLLQLDVLVADFMEPYQCVLFFQNVVQRCTAHLVLLEVAGIQKKWNMLTVFGKLTQETKVFCSGFNSLIFRTLTNAGT